MPLVKDLTRLEASGTNICLWERQLKLLIRQLLGLGLTYLDDPTNNLTDSKTDNMALCMIMWSIDESLQASIKIDCSAGELFRLLKNRFTSSSLSQVTHLTDSGQLTLAQLRDLFKSVSSDLDILFTQLEGSTHSQLTSIQSFANVTNQLASIRSNPVKDQCTLSSLPAEVIDQIGKHVWAYSTEESRQMSKIKMRKTVVMKDGMGRLSIGRYYPGGEPPVLNCFQSLASVNRKIYHALRPRLWKVSSISFHPFESGTRSAVNVGCNRD